MIDYCVLDPADIIQIQVYNNAAPRGAGINFFLNVSFNLFF
jgi:hypothetical protein